MKSVFIAAIIVGVASAIAIYFATEDSTYSTRRRGFRNSDDIEDAADNAFSEMNRHVGRVERKTEDIIDKAFS